MHLGADNRRGGGGTDSFASLMSGFLPLLLTLMVVPAYAQGGTAPATPAPAETPTVGVQIVEPLHKGEVWFEERGVSRYESRVVSLARAMDGGAWLAGLEDGTLIRSVDGARSWSRVLRPVGEVVELDAEEILLNAEAITTESAAEQASSFDEVEDSTDYDESDVSTDQSGEPEPPPEAATDLPDATETEDISGDTLLRHGESTSIGATVWFSGQEPGLALAGRPDGLWRSLDAGLSWTRVDGEADARSFLALPESGTILAGTGSGLRISPDAGERWLDVEDITDNAEIAGLSLVGRTVVAATSRGLFASEDALRWRGLGWTEPATSVLGDPTWEGGMWVATERGVLRSDNGGATFSSLSRQSLRGVTTLSALKGPAHVMAYGSDGVWETTDGAVTWHPISSGLRDPDVRAAVVVDGRPIIATSRAMWRLRPTNFGVGGLSSRPKAIITDSDQRMLGMLVITATEREGLDLERVQARKLAAKGFFPTLTLQAKLGLHDNRSSQFVSGDTTQGGKLAYALEAKACFGGCLKTRDVSGEVDTGDYDGLGSTDFDAESAITETMLGSQYVLGGEVMGEESDALAAANVSQKIRKYRVDIADQVVGAWSALVRIRALPAPDSLTASVDQVLQVQELEARLDLYTDGAYTRAKFMEPG